MVASAPSRQQLGYVVSDGDDSDDDESSSNSIDDNMFGGMNRYFVQPNATQYFSDSFVTDESETEEEEDMPYSSEAEESFFGEVSSDTEHTTEDVLAWDVILDKRPATADDGDEDEDDTEDEEESDSGEEEEEDAPADPFASIQVVSTGGFRSQQSASLHSTLAASPSSFTVTATANNRTLHSADKTKTTNNAKGKGNNDALNIFVKAAGNKHKPLQAQNQQQQEPTNESAPKGKHSRRSSIADRRSKGSRNHSGKASRRLTRGSSRRSTNSMEEDSSKDHSFPRRRHDSTRNNTNADQLEGSATKDHTRRGGMGDKSNGTQSTGTSSHESLEDDGSELLQASGRDHSRRRMDRSSTSTTSSSSRRHLDASSSDSSKRHLLDASKRRSSGRSLDASSNRMIDGSSKSASRRHLDASHSNRERHRLNKRGSLNNSSRRHLDASNTEERRSRRSSLDQSNSKRAMDGSSRRNLVGASSGSRRNQTMCGSSSSTRNTKEREERGRALSAAVDEGAATQRRRSLSRSRRRRSHSRPRRGAESSSGSSRRHLEPETPGRTSSRTLSEALVPGGQSRRNSESSSNNDNKQDLAPKTPGRNASRRSLHDISTGCSSSRRNSESSSNNLSAHITGLTPKTPKPKARLTEALNRTNRRNSDRNLVKGATSGMEPKTPRRHKSSDTAGIVKSELARGMEPKTPRRHQSSDAAAMRRSESARDIEPKTPSGRLKSRRYSENARSESARLIKTPSCRRHSLEPSLVTTGHRRKTSVSNVAGTGSTDSTVSSTSTTANSTFSGDGSQDTNAVMASSNSIKHQQSSATDTDTSKNDVKKRAKSLMESHLKARSLIQKYSECGRGDNASANTADTSDDGIETAAADTVQAVIHDANDHEASVATMNYDNDIDESSVCDETPFVSQKRNNLHENDSEDEDEEGKSFVSAKPRQQSLRRRRSNDPDIEREATSNRRLSRHRQSFANKAEGKVRGIGRSSSEPTEKLHEIFSKQEKVDDELETTVKRGAGRKDIGQLSATEHMPPERGARKRGGKMVTDVTHLERATSTSQLKF